MINPTATTPVEDSDLPLLQEQDDSQATIRSFMVPAGVWGQRLDKQLAALLPEQSRARLQGWIEEGHVCVNGDIQTRVRQSISSGDVITVTFQPSDATLAYTPEDIPLDVVAQSDHWIVLDKPVGLVVHPGAGNWQGTLLNGLLFHFKELATVARAGIVHRLDKDTSGLMVVARTPEAQTALVRQLQAREVERQYVALAQGHVKPRVCKVSSPIGRDARVPVRMSVVNPVAPKEAITHVQCERLGAYDGIAVSQVRCRLETGRTHQIRVHLASLGYPLLGDPLYGGRHVGLAQRQMLHAERLAFVDPASGQVCRFEREPPADMQAVIESTSWSLEHKNG
jgi:23S rRNA pseudouridine1911/1915/1917 synthase